MFCDLRAGLIGTILGGRETSSHVPGPHRDWHYPLRRSHVCEFASLVSHILWNLKHGESARHSYISGNGLYGSLYEHGTSIRPGGGDRIFVRALVRRYLSLNTFRDISLLSCFPDEFFFHFLFYISMPSECRIYW